MYARKGHRVSITYHLCLTVPQVKMEGKYLIPTKATLFGLDVRFRAIDQKMEEEKSKMEND